MTANIEPTENDYKISNLCLSKVCDLAVGQYDTIHSEIAQALAQQRGEFEKEIDRLKAENLKLREAIKKIQEHWKFVAGTSASPMSTLIRMAEEALEGEK